MEILPSMAPGRMEEPGNVPCRTGRALSLLGYINMRPLAASSKALVPSSAITRLIEIVALLMYENEIRHLRSRLHAPASHYRGLRNGLHSIW